MGAVTLAVVVFEKVISAPAVPQNSVIKETSTKRYARIFFM
jgi:hypothetical protein